MKQMLTGVLGVILLTASTAGAQKMPAQPDIPNLKFEIAIVDEGGGGPVTRKDVVVIARANNTVALVRSHGMLPPGHPLSTAMRNQGISIGLSVDAKGNVHQDGRIQASVAVEYQPFWPEAKSLPSSVTAQLEAMFDAGRKTLVSQAADPLSDRKTTIEVTVTIVK
jgi:hypothetical protein